jgi:hypothetical protein
VRLADWLADRERAAHAAALRCLCGGDWKKQRGKKEAQMMCNFCTLQQIKANAKAKGQTITVLADGTASKNVYVHPKGVDVRALSDQRRLEYFTAWLDDLTPECVC